MQGTGSFSAYAFAWPEPCTYLHRYALGTVTLDHYSMRTISWYYHHMGLQALQVVDDRKRSVSSPLTVSGYELRALLALTRSPEDVAAHVAGLIQVSNSVACCSPPAAVAPLLLSPSCK